MKVSELRKIIEEYPKYEGTEKMRPSNLVNSGFPSCFNLSFGEGPMHEIFGQYLDYSKDLVFTTIQPCIRHEDWKTITEGNEDSFRYLNLFDMAGIGGMTILMDGSKVEEVAKFHMKAEIEFFKKVGLDISKLKILYFKGAPVEEATSGKYKIDKTFEEDPLHKYWLELGIKEEQLVPDATRDTMLALNVFGLPTPWGYRYEILYDYNDHLWDIATVEYLNYRPTFDDEGNIKDIVPFNHCLGASVVGLERIATILQEKKNVWEVDSIYPLIEFLVNKSEDGDEYDAVVAIQAFRAIHKIVSDGNLYKDLNTRRKEYIRKFYREFFNRIIDLGIEYDSNLIEELCDINSQLNPWYPELNDFKDNLISEFQLRKEAFDNDKSIKNRGVAQ